MYVRWQQYHSQALNPSVRKHKDERARLKAVLVESVRVDGEPRQKHVAFLGSTSIDGGDRLRFWYKVTTRLNRLSNRLLPAERERIGAAIAKKVGGSLLTKAQLAQYEHDRKQLWTRSRALPPVE